MLALLLAPGFSLERQTGSGRSVRLGMSFLFISLADRLRGALVASGLLGISVLGGVVRWEGPDLGLMGGAKS